MAGRGSRGPSGVLPVPASATQKGAEKKPGENNSTRPAPRLKLVVRRLPPGLTQAEFEAALGEEWKVGNGRVDWYEFRPGKVTKGMSKPSRPGCAYIHVSDQTWITVLHEKVRHTQFNDVANTTKDSVLPGPPYVQYAPFSRVPKRSRKDKRQGTIDQDPDFIAFLESLTNPIPKPTQEALLDEPKDEISPVTPLIQYMKDKRARQARAKENAAAARSMKLNREVKEVKPDKGKRLLSRAEKEREKRDRSTSAAPSPVIEPAKDRAAKEPAKGIKAGKAAGPSEVAAAKEKAAKEAKQKEKAVPPTGPAMDRKKDKGKAPARNQQREPAGEVTQETKEAKDARAREARAPREPRGAKGRKVEKEQKAEAKKAEGTTAAQQLSKDGGAPPAEAAPKPPRGPKSRKEKTKEKAKARAEEAAAQKDASAAAKGALPTEAAGSGPSIPKQAAQTAPAQPQPQQAPAATQAFLKHANPSQGVTEENLLTGFSIFGNVLRTEIDKKKGFGYVDFAGPEGLRKAIAASPVQIAQSKVVVLERKSAPQVAMARSGARAASSASGRGQAQAQVRAQVQGQVQVQAEQQPQIQPQPQPQTQSQTPKQPPTAPAAERTAAPAPGKAPPTGPRSGRRSHRHARSGRGANKSSGGGGTAAPAPAAAAAAPSTLGSAGQS